MFNNSALKDVVSGGNRMGLDLGILELFSHLHDSIRCSCPGQPLPVSCSCAIQGLLRGTGKFPTLVESFQQLLPSGIPLEEQFQAEESRAVPRPPPSSDPVSWGRGDSQQSCAKALRSPLHEQSANTRPRQPNCIYFYLSVFQDIPARPRISTTHPAP